MSNRFLICLTAGCIFSAIFTGCKNRCNQPYGFPYQQPLANAYGNQYGYANPLNANSRSPLIPPPATGTLNIPSIARNNPYGLNQNRGLLNTNQRAPTPAADRAATFNQQNGWKPSDGNFPVNNTINNNSNQSTGTTLGFNPSPGGSGNAPIQVAPPNANSVLVQNGAARQGNGFGESFINSTDYATTSVNESNDRTRLPATDASAVRAPSQYYARVQGARLAQMTPQIAGGQQPYYVPGQGQLAPAQLAFNQNSTVRVQDQGTATYDPYSNTRSADWRNQDDGSDPF